MRYGNVWKLLSLMLLLLLLLLLDRVAKEKTPKEIQRKSNTKKTRESTSKKKVKEKKKKKKKKKQKIRSLRSVPGGPNQILAHDGTNRNIIKLQNDGTEIKFSFQEKDKDNLKRDTKMKAKKKQNSRRWCRR